MKIAVIGSGSWGTALAQTLSDNGHDVLIYGICAEEVSEINDKHTNSRYFGETSLPTTLRATTDISATADYGDVFLLAVPTRFFGDALEKLAPYISKKTIVVNVAKGFSWDTDERLSVYIEKKTRPRVLCGRGVAYWTEPCGRGRFTHGDAYLRRV